MHHQPHFRWKALFVCQDKAMSGTSNEDFNIGYIDGHLPGNVSSTAADTHKATYQLYPWSCVAIAIGPGETGQFQRDDSYGPNGVFVYQLWHDQLEEIKEQEGLIQDLLNHVCVYSYADAIQPPRTPANQVSDIQEGSQDIPLSTESARSEVAVDRLGSQYRCRESLEPERSEELPQRSEFIEFPGSGRSSRRGPLEFIRNVYSATRRRRRSTPKSGCGAAAV